MPALAPYSFWRLLTTPASGPWAIITLVAEILAVAWYLRAVGLLRARGGSWPLKRSVYFVVGILNIALAWQSGVAVYAGSVFTVHIVQHIALMLTAPMLLAVSNPVTLASETLSDTHRAVLNRVLSSKPWRMVSHPLPATIINFGLMYWFFLDHGIVLAMAHAPFMDTVNLAFLVAGALTWWPILSSDWIGRQQLPYPARIALSFLGMPLDSFLVIALLPGGARVSIAPNMYNLGGVQAGAVVFWIIAEFITGLGLSYVAAEWLRQERGVGRRFSKVMDERNVVVGGSGAAGWSAENAVRSDGWIRVPWATGGLDPEARIGSPRPDSLRPSVPSRPAANDPSALGGSGLPTS